MSFKRFTKAPDSPSLVRSGNLRGVPGNGVSGKRKRLDWYDASKKFMKVGTTLGTVARGIYSIAKYNHKRHYRDFDFNGYPEHFDTDFRIPFADMV